MFLFYHSKQNDENKDYYKGILFEKLIAEYLNACGYDSELRRKRNSLEYDILGTDRPTKLKIIGEAKAHDKTISGQIFTSFVGKLIPEGLFEKKIKGIFISTSSLSPDADDYYHKIRNYGVISITGQDLFKAIKSELGFINSSILSTHIEKLGYRFVTDYILATDTGYYSIVIAKAKTSGTPSYFSVFQDDGTLNTDSTFLNSLKSNVSELQALEPIIGAKPYLKRNERIIAEGLTVGTNWIDYRLPAGPNFFIGREDFILRIKKHIEANDNNNIIQIKSRSGVGKSSVLAYLEKYFKEANYKTELHDARDIKSPLDIYSIIQRFTDSSSIPKDMKDVALQLKSLNDNSKIAKAIFMVDQFESTFSNPMIFSTYENIANIALNYSGRIFILFARKNDQLTTYDDSKISLERINSFSQSFVLNDFLKNEAISLIEKIKEESSVNISPAVLAYVLEFAQGFPWLLKRTMAHIIRLVSSGIGQGELFAASLKLNDLFNEELEELDEIERDYLYRIANRLPADYNQLQRQFDEDPFLPKVLDKLTRSRLLRLSGSTYDTYNDVFKEYLKYQKLPEFRQPIIYRMYPNGVITPFHKLVKLSSFDLNYLKSEFNLSKGSAFNLLRELSNLNLIRNYENKWIVPQTVKDIYKNGRLGEYIRRQLLENNTVSHLVSLAAQNEPLHSDNLANFLSEQFPFVEASVKTWKTYATMMKAYLTATKILVLDKNGYLVPPPEERKLIVESLGNLSNLITYNRRQNYEFFLPSVRLNKLDECLIELKLGHWPKKRAQLKALSDLKKGGWVVEQEIIVNDIEELHEQAAELISTQKHKEIYTAAIKGEYLLPVARKILGENYSSETLKWRIKILLSWAKQLDIIPNKRYKYEKRSKRNKKMV